VEVTTPLKGVFAMPYEVVQRAARTLDNHHPAGSATEMSLRWEKDASFVQMKIERFDDSTNEWVHADGIVSGTISSISSVLGTLVGNPPQPSRFPVGTIRVNGDGSQIAYKTKERVDNATTGSAAMWTVVHTGRGDTEECVEDAIEDWPVIFYPDDRPVPTTIWTDTLNRDEINRFIRALRRARDAAYGADA
jgi:hypothetical protein